MSLLVEMSSTLLVFNFSRLCTLAVGILLSYFHRSDLLSNVVTRLESQWNHPSDSTESTKHCRRHLEHESKESANRIHHTSVSLSLSRALSFHLFLQFQFKGLAPFPTLLCTHELWRLHGSTHEPPLQETEPWALLNPPLKQPNGEGTTLVVAARCGLQGPTMGVYLVTPRYTVPAASSVVLSPQYASCIPAVL